MYTDGQILSNDKGEQVKYNAASNQWQPVEKQAEPSQDFKPNNVLDDIVGGARAVTEGMTFGFGDEAGLGVAAGIAGLTEGVNPIDAYKDMRTQYNKKQKRFDKENPKASLALNLGGGLLTGGAGAGRVAATQFAKQSPKLAASVVGAGVGGGTGAGYAPTMKDVPMYAGAGAAGGAVLAPVAQVTGKTAGNLWGDLKHAMTAVEPDKRAARVANEYLVHDGKTPNELMSKALAMGDNATLTDAGGRSFMNMAKEVVNRQSEKTNAASDFYLNRQAGSQERVLSSLKSLSGGNDNYFANYKGILESRKAQAKPLYEEAAQTSVPVEKMQGIVRDLSEQAKSFEPLQNIVKKFIAGKGDNRRLKTSNKELHALQMQLSDDINSAWRNGRGEEAEQIQIYKDQILQAMNDASPAYAQARKVYADKSASLRAMDAGRNVLKGDTDEIAANILNLSQTEQEMYINGAIKTISDKLKTGREQGNASIKLASTLVRERLKNAFPDDASYNKFITQLDIEDTFARVNFDLYGGSQTHMRGNAREALDNAILGRKPLAGTSVLEKLKSLVWRKTGVDDIPVDTINALTELVSKPVSQFTAKDKALMNKYQLTLDDIYQTSGQSGTAATNAAIGSSQYKVSN